MVFPSASLRAHFSVPVRVKPSKTTNYGASSAASLSFRGNSPQNYRLALKLLMRSKQLSVARCAGETISMTMDSSSEQTSTYDSVSAHATEPVMEDEEKSEEEGLDYHEMIRVCDKLIEVFLVDKPAPADWRRLLAFSHEWDNIRSHFFRRCQERADSEDNPEMKVKLFRLERKLKEIDKDVQRHNELIDVIMATPSEINDIVARRRKDFTEEFFMHFHAVVQSYNDDPAYQNALSELGNMCLDAVQAYDTACGEADLLNAAQLKFEDIINSPSLDVACRKIDSLAERNQLDSALALMVTKAWASAKETSAVKDEVKDMLYYLYVKSRDYLQTQLPKEIRILKYILRMKDPEEQIYALKDAFTQVAIPPVEGFQDEEVDILYTTPETFHSYMMDVVNAYDLCPDGSLIREARDMMDPEIIVKIENLIRLVEKNFL